MSSRFQIGLASRNLRWLTLKRSCSFLGMRRQQGLLPNRIKLEIHDKIEVGCLTTLKEEAAQW